MPVHPGNSDLSGKRITVMGLGRFGGGIGVTRWLADRGADVLVTDTSSADDLADSVAKIQPLIDHGRVSLRLGEHNVSDFTTCDMVVANAAVPTPWNNRFLRAAEAANVPITTEIALLVGALHTRGHKRIIGITGSVGKSTTTAMVHHALEECLRPRSRRALVGGNLGGSLLEHTESLSPDDWVVLELSSAMLYWIDRVLGDSGRFAPRVAVVTNISPNHIDWHGDLDHYRASKQTLISRQSSSDAVILGEAVRDWRSRSAARAFDVNPAAFTADLRIPGQHNRVNAAAALAACRAAEPDLSPADLARAIAGFPGLPHRLQLAAEGPLPRAGAALPRVRFYNDSKSTTPESAIKAVEALAEMPGVGRSRIHLIAGGYDKGSDLSAIASVSADLAGLYTIGVTGPGIAAAAGGEARRAFACGTLDRAVSRAMERMSPGDALLLSPGCASWDQYVNFEQRGDEFVTLVRRLIRP